MPILLQTDSHWTFVYEKPATLIDGLSNIYYIPFGIDSSPIMSSIMRWKIKHDRLIPVGDLANVQPAFCSMTSNSTSMILEIGRGWDNKPYHIPSWKPTYPLLRYF